MAILKKAAVAALIATGLSVGAEAAVQTYELSGDAEFFTLERAALFGVETGTTGRLRITFEFDPLGEPDGTSDITAYPAYGYVGDVGDWRSVRLQNLAGTVGNQAIIYTNTSLDLTDYQIPSTTYTVKDRLEFDIYDFSFAQRALDNGVPYDGIHIAAFFHYETVWGEAFSDVLAFNDASETEGGFLTPDGDYQSSYHPSYQTVQFYNLSLRAIGGVPEPATWLTLVMGFGLAGVAVRRRRVVLAA